MRRVDGSECCRSAGSTVPRSSVEYDALHARLWGGLHFRDAMDDGYDLGHRIARRVMRDLR